MYLASREALLRTSTYATPSSLLPPETILFDGVAAQVKLCISASITHARRCSSISTCAAVDCITQDFVSVVDKTEIDLTLHDYYIYASLRICALTQRAYTELYIA